MVKDSVTMEDGSEAWLTSSGRYYVRRYRLTPKLRKEVPESVKWDGIAYYDLKTKQRIALATATCGTCEEIISSLYCGHFVTCGCGMTSVDTDRWEPERHRLMGDFVKDS